jgi:hypothetical protein
MINKKKKINKIKTQKFLDDFSIKFLLQHNNFTVKDWFDFRQKIQEISENSVEILNVKNSLLKQNFENGELLDSLCQGPNFLIGCKNDTHLKSIWNYIHSNSKLLFISCLYKNQLLNHLDLDVFFKTDLSVYSKLFQILDKKTELSNTLQHHLQIRPLVVIQSESIQILESLKELKNKN